MSKFVQISLIGGGTYTQRLTKQDIGVLVDEIMEGDVGEKWEVELIEMTEQEYSELPEFTGH